MSYPIRTTRNAGTPSAQTPSYQRGGSNFSPYTPSILTPAPTKTGNPIGRPSNALLAARQAEAARLAAQGITPNFTRTAASNRQSSNLRQSATPAPAPPIGHHAGMAAAGPQVYYRNRTFPEGPLPFYLPPPGQPTLDATLQAPARSQGIYTTYPARMRTGVTGLVQPETITGGLREREAYLADWEREMHAARSGSGASTPRFDSPAPTPGASSLNPYARPQVRSTLSGRRSRAVNYVEKGSDEDSDSSLSELDEPASDPEDDNYGGGGKRARDADKKTRDEERKAAKERDGYDAHTAQKMVKLRKRREELEKGWTWLGERVPGERVTGTSVGLGKYRHQYYSQEQLEDAADTAEVLIPISIDIDVPGRTPEQANIKIKDRFLWNLNEPFLTPRQFAHIFIADLSLPADTSNTIVELIQSQIEEAQGVAEVDITDPEVGEDEVVFSDDEVEEAVGETVGAGASGDGLDADGLEVEDGDGDAEEEAAEVEEEKSWAEADCRIIINLDVQICTHILRDRIEWDLSSTLPPSEFASHYCRDLGLSGEAVPLVAHAIHEEILKHKKDALDLRLFKASHPEEQAKWEKTPGWPRVNFRSGAKALKGVWRDWFEREEFGPVLIELSFEEMERREVERNREQRRIMRGMMGKRRR